MTLMTRVIRIFQADIHGVMDQLEDPELLVRQYVREMEAGLRQDELRLQELGATARLLSIEHDRCRQEADKIGQDLECAVSRSKDDIARLLIRKKLTLQKQRDRLQGRLDSLQAESAQLAGQLEEQRLRFDAVRLQAQEFCSRHNRNGLRDYPAGCNDTEQCFKVDTGAIELELMRVKQRLEKTGGAAC